MSRSSTSASDLKTAGYGRHLLLVTGARSFVESAARARLFADFRSHNLSWAPHQPGRAQAMSAAQLDSGELDKGADLRQLVDDLLGAN